LDGVASIILTGVERVRTMGYQRVILLGQSRGAFGSIQAAAQHPEIDGILALAPGWTADYGKSSEWRRNDFDIRPYWDKYAGTTYRIAAAFFENDDLYETKEPHVRGPYAHNRLTELGVTNFILDQPKYAGMAGHHGGTSWEFARRLGPCLVYFFETGSAPSCAESDAATAAIFGIVLPNLPDGNGYAGLWQGTWSNGRFLALAIQPPVNSRHSAVYWQGAGVNSDKAQSSTWNLIEKDGDLVHAAAVEFRLRLEGDGRLRVTRTDGRTPGKAPDPPVYFVRAK
jgi:pimeloyl-ACP methyl ester carboxylesterase